MPDFGAAYLRGVQIRRQIEETNLIVMDRKQRDAAVQAGSEYRARLEEERTRLAVKNAWAQEAWGRAMDGEVLKPSERMRLADSVQAGIMGLQGPAAQYAAEITAKYPGNPYVATEVGGLFKQTMDFEERKLTAAQGMIKTYGEQQLVAEQLESEDAQQASAMASAGASGAQADRIRQDTQLTAEREPLLRQDMQAGIDAKLADRDQSIAGREHAEGAEQRADALAPFNLEQARLEVENSKILYDQNTRAADREAMREPLVRAKDLTEAIAVKDAMEADGRFDLKKFDEIITPLGFTMDDIETQWDMLDESDRKEAETLEAAARTFRKDGDDQAAKDAESSALRLRSAAKERVKRRNKAMIEHSKKFGAIDDKMAGVRGAVTEALPFLLPLTIGEED